MSYCRYNVYYNDKLITLRSTARLSDGGPPLHTTVGVTKMLLQYVADSKALDRNDMIPVKIVRKMQEKSLDVSHMLSSI